MDMDNKSRELITDAAIFLQHFDRTNTRFLKQPLQTALLVIQQIEKGQTTVGDLSLVLCLSRDTVAQVIRALREGGYPFVVEQAGTQGCKYLVSIAPS
jgi:biotin operon repressor